jgi:hypothetical protein
MSGFIDEADRNPGTLLPERIEEYVTEESHCTRIPDPK